MGNLFGTDGVRGIANAELTPELAFRLGRAGAARVCGGGTRPLVAVGRDTRVSGDMLESALVAGLCSAGADVIRLGVVPTPAVAWLTKAQGAQAGVMISASHNPVEDNGIKFFSAEGFKLPDDVEEEIEILALAEDDDGPRPIGESVGGIRGDAGVVDRYVEAVTRAAWSRLEGVTVVVDGAHGAAYALGPRVLSALGATVIPIHCDPDGSRINIGCGSTHPAALQQRVVAEGAHLGVAFDGDADRCIAVDETGRLVDGDHAMLIFAQDLKARGALARDTVVATVMSNFGLERALAAERIRLVRTRVGDRYVLEEMRKQGAVLGGEQSGHLILLDHNTTGDGILTAVQLASRVVASKEPLSRLAGQLRRLPQLLVNVKVTGLHKDRWEQDGAIAEAIAEMEDLLQDRGRLLVRSSGTEPLIRVMAEGPDEAELRQVVDTIAHLIEKKLG